MFINKRLYSNRAGPAGLHPQTLPHHRTYRFHLPAIEPSNYCAIANIDGIMKPHR